MGADPALKGRALMRLAPGGSAIPIGALRTALAEATPEAGLREALRAELGAADVSFHASGREALRVAFGYLAELTGRTEVVVPGYCCFSVPAAAVAAGLRVRLVDVDPLGRIDAGALAGLPLERAAAVLIGNLFGLPEPLDAIAPIAAGAQAPLIDDAAQALGARSPEGAAGVRGRLGVLSFGRGKPLSALGGGALVWTEQGDANAVPSAVPGRRLRAVVEALAYDLARNPFLLRVAAAIPALGIGRTVYDPDFRHGAIDGASLCLANGLLPSLGESNRDRRERAESIAARIETETGFTALRTPMGSVGVYPRLGLMAPSAESRNAALRRLTWLGATTMYPTALDEIPALEPHLAGETSCPGAHAFCARLLTVPTHSGLTPARQSALIKELGRAG
jgi:dTDP-4-amino-4,6-dideoxygalactose transaminase